MRINAAKTIGIPSKKEQNGYLKSGNLEVDKC